MLLFFAHAGVVAVRREGQHVRRLVVGDVDAVARVDEEVALLLAQQVSFGLRLTTDAAALEHRNLVGVAGRSAHRACPVR